MTVVNRGGVDIAEPFDALWHFHAELGLEDCTWEDNNVLRGEALTGQ